MKHFSFFAFLLIALYSCKKDDTVVPVVNPKMIYTDLQNAEVKQGTYKKIDIDHDGKDDFLFSTLLVGDPVYQQDKLQFYAHSGIGDYLLNNEDDQSPVLDQSDHIAFDHPGYTWYEISAIVVAQKVTGVAAPPYWEGRWMNASHKYLPVQLKRNGQEYLGWIELSFDKAGEKLILHKAAISIEHHQNIKAGL